jgi:hypothetical protein
MQRRDVSVALFASAAGSTLLTQRATAQSCTAPCFARTAAEVNSGVTPANTQYSPDHVGYDVRRTGATGLGSADDSAAIATAASVGSALYFAAGTYRVASSLVLGVPCLFDYRAVLKPDAGVTVTLNAPVIAGAYTIFNLANAAAGSTPIQGSLGGVDLLPQWWGVVADGDFNAGTGTDNASALQSCINTAQLQQDKTNAAPNKIRIPAGIYRQESQVTVGDNIFIEGSGRYTTVFFTTTGVQSGLWLINGTTGGSTTIQNLAIIGKINGVSGSGLVSKKNGLFLKDLWVAAFTSPSYPAVIIDSTDNFLEDSVFEYNAVGVLVSQCDVIISNCKSYNNSSYGYQIQNAAGADPGRVTLDHCHSGQDGAVGFLVSSGSKHVTFNACDVSSPNAAYYTTAGFQIDGANDVVMSACTGILGAQGTSGSGIYVSSSSTNVQINGGTLTGFYYGLLTASATVLNVVGGLYSGNNQYGIYINGGDQTNLVGVCCNNNGVGGACLDATQASSKHACQSPMTNNNNGYGLVLNAASSTAKINCIGSIASGNTSGSIQSAGTVANIQVIGSL